MRSHLRDRSLLVRAPGDLRVDARAAQGATLHASAMELLELAAGVEPLDRTGGIAGSTVPGGVVPDLVLPPVGQEDDRPLIESALERIGVELCLAGAGGGVAAGALGLDEAERCPVLSPQHVVDPADAGLVDAGQDGQPVHGVLAILGLLQRPSRI